MAYKIAFINGVNEERTEKITNIKQKIIRQNTPSSKTFRAKKQFSFSKSFIIAMFIPLRIQYIILLHHT